MNAKSDAIYAMAKDFRSRGVPLDGVGFQMHINLSFTDPKTLSSFASNLKRFGDLGMEIHITELDVALDSADPAGLGSAVGTLREGHPGLYANSYLPGVADMGIYRQVLMDSKPQPWQARLGPSLRCGLQDETRVQLNSRDAAEAVIHWIVMSDRHAV